MLIAVAAAAVLMVPLAESYRRHLAAYHAEQEMLSEQKARELLRKGWAAHATGRSRQAEGHFATFNYWNERARGHLRMQKVYRDPWWLFGR
jgi:hypothetical protein